jgi:hypothetical protein
MTNKAQRVANKAIKKAGGRRMVVRRSPLTKTRRAFDMTKEVKKVSGK